MLASQMEPHIGGEKSFFLKKRFELYFKQLQQEIL